MLKLLPLILSLAIPHASQAATWQLVMEYRGDAFVIDHSLTLADCLAALPRNDVARHVTFACERGQ